MKIFITLLGLLLIVLVCFFCTAFVCWDMNASNWHWLARLIYMLVSISSIYVWISYMERFGK